MEALTATLKVSDDGTLTLPVPPSFKGARVKVQYRLERQDSDVGVDEKGWPIGFWEGLMANPITDPKFKRLPQGEAEPPPSFA